MLKLRHFIVLTAVCLFGCTKEYEPPKESIPDIPPGRSAMKAKGEATEGNKTASPASAGKKSGSSGGAPMPPR